MKRPHLLTAIVLLLAVPQMVWGDALSLDSCRAMALRNNKTMRIMAEKIKKAGYDKDQAFAAYLPQFDFTGGYTYNQKKLSIFDSDQLLPTKTFNLQTQQYEFNLVKNPMTGEPVKGPNGEYVPETVALIPKEAMTYDIHNVFFGAVTLTQPVFMGGKIVAMNKITGFAEELAKTLHNREAQNMVYAVDAAYWQVVSLKSKERLAEQYIQLLDTLHRDVSAMIDEGVATRSDLLSVDVKLNSAQVDLVKVQDGLVLSRMALAQLCGLPVDTPITLVDESPDANLDTAPAPALPPMEDIYSQRPDVQALELGIKIREQQAVVARSDMMPTLAVVGAYEFSNPNMYNGFKKKFAGAFSVGAMLRIPLWHWGANYNKYRSAKSEKIIAELELEDAKEMIDLQVNQARFKVAEAEKTHTMTQSNMANADENLRCATLGYKEGVMTLTNVMEAQTAWLKANSEKIDADIDVRLCQVYLRKVLGTLTY